MKKHIKILFLTTVLLVGCTPDTEEIRIIRTEEIKKPNIVSPTVDLTKVVVLFEDKEQSYELYRDPNTKMIEEQVFSFAPKFTKRSLEEGEFVKLKLVVKHNNEYQSFLPQEAYIIEKGEAISSEDKGFIVKLKADAFKDATKYQEDKEYVLSFGVQVSDVSPKDLPILGIEEVIYQIKVKITEFKFPEGDNIEEVSDITGAMLTDFQLSSNYAQDHLGKLTDGYSWTNWWVNTNNPNIFLKATFSEPKLVRGVKIKTPRRSWSNKFLGGVDITVLPGNGSVKTFYQGTYTHTNNVTGEIVLKFIQPITIKEIKLHNFKKGGDQYVDINELEFY
ncbi:hypothetical protein [Capnocytophaga canimorsus]|uniref:Exported protein n=1 Tax=Capnocytophaga canimorsus (strain 5) TaxID=860228 RepID=F9YUD7_CAPCC|nr:hypothetical protein [Capnocytophaga canimorsus]AEK22992.1 Putative exported protein [Capnocytophaga canimorsus Cc5]WGU67629.1 hypothetical protein QIU19_08785 [Capnocytophaga canimorsus]CEN43538.1 putative exported protein [Capnocytophaga canimorsus]VEJ18116.1 Uncharacterised protein [Capnocytophaga canimorsus]